MLTSRSRAVALTALGAVGFLAPTLTAGLRAHVAPANSAKASRTEQQLEQEVSRAPLFFEANQGQSDPQVRYLARSGSSVLFLTDSEAVVANRPKQPGSKQAVLRMRPAGKARAVRPKSESKQSGVSNYFVGRDESKWKRNVPHFASVRYASVYPKIDLVYHGTQNKLEYDFVVAPGGKPEDIRVAFSGAENARLDSNGDLHLQVGDSTLTQPRPVLYQDIQGVRTPVDGSFEIAKADPAAKTVEVAFRVQDYDEAQALVIDPTLWYSTHLGGSGGDACADIDVDATGRAIVTGSTASANFPSASPVQPDQPQTDAFVTCYSATTDATQTPTLIYSTYFGGVGFDEGAGIEILGGHAVIVGTTGSDNLPVLTFDNNGTAAPVGFDNTFNGGSGEFPTDVFLARFDDNGGGVIYSTYFGGSDNEFGLGIAQDFNGESSLGNVFITGRTDSTNFPLSQVRAQPDQPGTDAFVAKFHPIFPTLGTASLIYSTYLGGNNSDQGSAISVNTLGEAFVTGNTLSTNFPLVINAAISPFQNNPPAQDAFLTRVRANGSGFVYSTYLGGTATEQGNGVAVDPNDPHVVYVGGSTASNDFPRRFAFDNSFVGATEGWVLGLDTHIAGNNGLLFSTYLGGGAAEAVNAVALDQDGNVWATGQTTSTNFPIAGPLQSSNLGSSDAFAAQLFFEPNIEGQPAFLLFISYLGGIGADSGRGITVDLTNRPYLAGVTASIENRQTLRRDGFLIKNAVQPVHAGGTEDGWVMKLGNTAGPLDPSGSIVVTPKRLQFGAVRAGETKTRTVRIHNRSNEPLAGHVGDIEAPFRVVEGGGEFVIAARGRLDVTVEFAPTEAGKALGTLAIQSSDPNKRLVNVPLKGKGKAAR